MNGSRKNDCVIFDIRHILLLALFCSFCNSQPLEVKTLTSREGRLILPQSVYRAVKFTDGRVLISDPVKCVIWVREVDGSTTVFSGSIGYSGSVDGSREQALFESPGSILVTTKGDIWIRDGYKTRIIHADSSVTTLEFQFGSIDGVGVNFLEWPTGEIVATTGSEGVVLLFSALGEFERVVAGGIPPGGAIPVPIFDQGGACVLSSESFLLVSGHNVLEVRLIDGSSRVRYSLDWPDVRLDHSYLFSYGDKRFAMFGYDSNGSTDIYTTDLVDPPVKMGLSGMNGESVVISGFNVSTNKELLTWDTYGNRLYQVVGERAFAELELNPEIRSNRDALYGLRGACLLRDRTLAAVTPQEIFYLDVQGKIQSRIGNTLALDAVDGNSSVATFSNISGVCEFPDGRVVVVDSGAFAIRIVDVSGNVSTLAGKIGESGSGDGPGDIARFGRLGGIAMLPDGSCLVVDNTKNAIRKLDSSGRVRTVRIFGQPTDTTGVSNIRFAVPDAQGGVYLVSSGNYYGGVSAAIWYLRADDTIIVVHERREVVPADWGVVREWSRDRVCLFSPGGCCTDNGGNLLVSDTTTNAIIQFSLDGSVHPVAGRPGHAGFVDGVGAGAQFDLPAGIATDGAGGYFVCDGIDGVVRSCNVAGSKSGKAYITNVSARVPIVRNDALPVLGFVYSGVSADMYIRTVGRGLTEFGIDDAVFFPTMKLFDGGSLPISLGANWVGEPAMQDYVEYSVGAFKDREGDGTLRVDRISHGAYTIQVACGERGTALVEAYDLSKTGVGGVMNISSLAWLEHGAEPCILGFNICGEGESKVLTRGVGRTLRKFGLVESVEVPAVQFYDSDGNLMEPELQSSQDIAEAAASIGAFRLDPDTNEFVAIYACKKGGYTMVLRSSEQDQTGWSLAECYVLR